MDVKENEPGFKFFTYKFLNREQSSQLCAIKNRNDAIPVISNFIKGIFPALDQLELFLTVDIFLSIWELQLEPIKISTIYGIFINCCTRLFSGYTSLSNLIDTFKNDLVMHSVQRPPISLKLINKAEFNSATDIFLTKIYSVHPLLAHIVTKKELLALNTITLPKFELKAPQLVSVKEISADTLPILAQFFPDKIVTEEDIIREAEEKRKRKIEELIHEEIIKLQSAMEVKMEEQEKQFIEKMG